MTALLPHETPNVTGPARTLADRFAALVPVIETERLTLRAPRLDDFPAYAEIAEGPDGRFLIDNPTRESAWFDFVQMTATWILRGHGAWTVTARNDDRPLGFVLIGFEPGDHEPELGYMFREAARGQGFASEASAAARDHAFATMELPALVSTIDRDNTPSLRVAEALGAVRDAAAEAAHDHQILVYRYSSPEAS